MILHAARQRIRQGLASLYGSERVPLLLEKIERLCNIWGPHIRPRDGTLSERDILLITYGDTLIGTSGEPPLRVLAHFLTTKLGDLFTLLHLLPFYPFSSDDGFAVQDFRSVRPDLGSWEDITQLAKKYRLVFDVVLNHVSASSGYMRSYAAGDPRFANFFIEVSPDMDVSTVFRTRNLPLFHEFQRGGERVRLWTTFGPDQVDLNYANPDVLLEMLDILLMYARRGASVLRLDAVPYLWKTPSTSCVHLPETHTLIRLMRDVLDAVAPHVLLLAEVNAPHGENVQYLGRGGDEAQIIYNFALAPLILWTLASRHAGKLTEWAAKQRWMGPRATYLNITATHDGIGMRPTEGLLNASARQMLVALTRSRGGDVTGWKANDGSFMPYELNINYFSALSDPHAKESPETQVNRFMLSQTIPLCLMGIPGIYIHSLLGSQNDVEAVRRTGRARSINRQQIPFDNLLQELANPSSLRAQVFERYCRLIRLRQRLTAFHPDAGQDVLDLGPEFFVVRRVNGETGESVLAVHNVTNRPMVLNVSGCCGRDDCQDVLSGEPMTPSKLENLEFEPYQARWLRNQTRGLRSVGASR